MEKKSGYALIGLSALTLFIGLIVFVVWLAWLPFNREYELFDIVFVVSPVSTTGTDLRL